MKRAVSFIFDFEDAVMHAVRDRRLDGVICGHIHSAAIKKVNGLTYINCGDWVESLTALAEDADGRLKLLHWNAGLKLLAELPPQAVAPLAATRGARA